MDYLVGFIFGFVVKEIYRLLQYLATSETLFIDNNWDKEWDWMSPLQEDDLP